MIEFIEGPAQPSHKGIVDSIVNRLLKKNRGMKVRRLGVSHCNSSTFVSIALGTDDEFKDTRLILVGKNGGVRLLNSKAHSQTKTRGLYNVVYGETK